VKQEREEEIIERGRANRVVSRAPVGEKEAVKRRCISLIGCAGDFRGCALNA